MELTGLSAFLVLLVAVVALVFGVVNAWQLDKVTEERDGALDALGMVLREQAGGDVEATHVISPAIAAAWYDDGCETSARLLEDGTVVIHVFDGRPR